MRPFGKLSGAGNDFVVLSRQQAPEPARLADWVRDVCRRRVGVGADGVVLVAEGPDGIRVSFYNADGLETAFCGNGLRCAARWLALERGQEEAQLELRTSWGPVRARVEGATVRTELPELRGEPRPVEPLLEGLDGVAYAVEAGVPHLCVLVAEPARVDVAFWGRRLRHDSRFAPEGVNVDFVARGPERPVPIRTFERGVEDETLACGSGAVAAALVLYRQAERASPVVFETRSGDRLEVDIEPLGASRYGVALGGPARLVYRGELP